MIFDSSIPQEFCPVCKKEFHFYLYVILCDGTPICMDCYNEKERQKHDTVNLLL